MKIAKIINSVFGRLPKPRALPLRSMSNNLPSEYCWEDWKRDAKGKHPFRYWLHETLPHWFRVHISMNIGHWWYWVRTHTYNRYHILDLRTDVGIKYKWGWIETDQAMFIACFNLLRSFVEEQDGLSYLKWEDQRWYANASQDEKDMHDKQRADLLEIKSIYDWWISGREKHHKEMAAPFEQESVRNGNFGRALKTLDDKDDEMLSKLIKYRRHLWT